MKQLLLLTKMLFIVSFVNGQSPILTSANYVPQQGNSFEITLLSTKSVSPGPSGSNVLWNLTTLDTTPDVSLNYTYVPVNSTQCASSYTNANLAYQMPSGSSVLYNYYYLSSASKFELLGRCELFTAEFLEYNDYYTEMEFPFTYQDNFTDTHSATGSGWLPVAPSFTIANYINNYTVTGTNTVTADGYGTLALPGASFNNILRVETIIRKKLFDGNINHQDSIIIYDWQSPFKKQSLLEITYLYTWDDTTAKPTTPYIWINYSKLYYTLGIKNFKTENKGVVIAPNPSSDYILVNDFENNRFTVEIINSFGAEVLRKTILKEEDKKIDVSSMANGAYIIKISSENKSSIKKFIKQ